MYTVLVYPADLGTPENPGGGFAIQYDIVEPRGTKNGWGRNQAILGTIFTALPEQLKDSSALEYTSTDFGALDMPGSLDRVIDAAWNEIKNRTGRQLTEQVVDKGLTVVNSLTGVGAGSARGLLNKYLGSAANPRLEFIFRSVTPRTFSFSYKFLPRDAAEARYVAEICRTFKKNALPKFSTGSGTAFLDLPNLFNIKFIRYNENQVLKTLFPIKQCALTNIEVDYAGQGFPAMHADGQPVSTNMTLSFQEINIITREDYDETLSQDTNTASPTPNPQSPQGGTEGQNQAFLTA